jgi:hypothetical protein
MKDILVSNGESFALNELHDGAALQIDRRNQHFRFTHAPVFLERGDTL